MEDFVEIVFRFYCLDWLGMSCQFLGMFLLARKKRIGFLVFATGNAAWIGYALITGSLAQIIANLIVGGLNLYGFYKWSNNNMNPISITR